MRWVVAALSAVLLAVFPLLSLFTQNQSELELDVLWLPLAICVLAAAVLFGIFWLITKSPAKAGAAASLSVVALFYFGLFVEKMSWTRLAEGWLLGIWLLLGAAGLFAILMTKRGLANLMLIVCVGAAVLTVPRLASIVIYRANHPSLSASDPRLWPTTLEPPTVRSGANRPDIYMIIPDDYARADVLKKYFRYDDSAFLGELRRRGFVVSDQVRSPYSDSESNIASALNMDYLSAFPRVLGKTSEDVRPVKLVMEDSRAARMLTSLGYRYVHLDTDDVTFASRNPDISDFASPDGLANLWMEKSVLRLAGGPLGFDQAARNARFRDSIDSQFAKLGSAPPAGGPRFVVFHTLLPHDPYLFGARGQSVTYEAHTDEDLATAAGRTYYLHQLQYLQGRILGAVDQVLAHAKSPPVIVIQSDEGFQANPEPFGEAAMQDLRVKGLEALYLPGHRGAGLPDPPNTVNTLRFVFNQYLGTHYPMLRSASYPEADLPYQYEEMHVR